MCHMAVLVCIMVILNEENTLGNRFEDGLTQRNYNTLTKSWSWGNRIQANMINKVHTFD